ncbi:MAG TPA: MBL fold metallo-hydrolase [Rubrobacteraceae bacterium]|nr:MBL fold metallo-hydrolase [Rubrobacteraceae bacterium]
MTDGVKSSGLGTQPVGEVAKVAEGVYQLKVPVPIPLVFVSAYLIEDSDGWTILDTGFDYPEGRAAWEAGARKIGIDLREDVSRIFVSHFHPDHLGAARWLQGLSGAPVYMLEEEIEHARDVWSADDGNFALLIEHLTRHGMPRSQAEEAAAGTRANLKLPEKLMALRANEEISLGGSAARVVHAPGHADHQYMLHDEARGILFAADHVLLKITPNVGTWPDVMPQPLDRYIKSLNNLRGMDAGLVLPGHGPVFHDLDGRIDELTRHHEERLSEMHGVLSDGPKTAFDVSSRVFREDLSVYERCFALAETLAHLDHLVLQDRAVKMQNGVVSYRAS